MFEGAGRWAVIGAGVLCGAVAAIDTLGHITGQFSFDDSEHNKAFGEFFFKSLLVGGGAGAAARVGLNLAR